MNVAVITDIHSNLPALEAVFEAIDAAGVEETWCLGDVVGYGAEPDACADLVRERCATCLVGNHDLAVLGALDTLRLLRDRRGGGRVDARDRSATATLEFLRDLQPDGSARASASSTPPRATRLGVRALVRAGGGLPGRAGGADQPDRPLARRAVLHQAGQGEPGRRAAPRRATGRCSTSAGEPGSSTPAASASRATATLGPPGWSWTPKPRPPASTASPTTSTAPRRRSPPPACRSASETASMSGRDAQMQGKSGPEAVV